jgi:hypothetical protein
VTHRWLLLAGFFILILGIALCVLSAIARADEGIVLDGMVPIPWRGLAPATCMPDRCFCERIHPGVIRQPINTWTNLGFVLAGIVVLATAVYDFTLAPDKCHTNPMQTQWIYPIIFGFAAILIGIGSFFYHLSLAFIGQVVDVLAMYWLTSFIMLYNMSRIRRMKEGVFAILYVVLNVGAGYASIRWPVLRRYIFCGFLLLLLISEFVVCVKRHHKLNKAYLWAAIVSLVLGCTFWLLDIFRVICLPDSLLQAHALWHIFMALAIGLVFFYFRSEQSP